MSGDEHCPRCDEILAGDHTCPSCNWPKARTRPRREKNGRKRTHFTGNDRDVMCKSSSPIYDKPFLTTDKTKVNCHRCLSMFPKEDLGGVPFETTCCKFTFIGMNHSPEWRGTCRNCGNAYGYKISRLGEALA